MKLDHKLLEAVRRQEHPLVFVTISGAHLYGFPSPDSDYDLRGVHVLPVRKVVGLDTDTETIEVSEDRDDVQLDLVTHDIKKFLRLLLKKNGYVLEQLFSPLIVHTTPEHAELKEIAHGCITRYHSHHYLGFAETEWKLLNKENPKRIKPLLYVYRVLLTGIHLMRTGKVEANLQHLNEVFKLPYVPELISRKVAGAEKSNLEDADMAFHEKEYVRLRTELEEASRDSKLPELPTGKEALNDLLIRVRLQPVSNSGS
ncbi:MAG: nucleotidyltransferase domain-containing protein [Candidatus Acidiferrum sp.]